jgi:hypothetical protein
MNFAEWLNTQTLDLVYHETDSEPSSFNQGIDFNRFGSTRWYGKGLYAWTSPPANSIFDHVLKFQISQDAKILDLRNSDDLKTYREIANECASNYPNYLDEIHRYTVHYGIDGVYTKTDFVVLYNSAKVRCVGQAESSS